MGSMGNHYAHIHLRTLTQTRTQTNRNQVLNTVSIPLFSCCFWHL